MRKPCTFSFVCLFVCLFVVVVMPLKVVTFFRCVTICMKLTLFFLNPDTSLFEIIVDPDQLAFDEAI